MLLQLIEFRFVPLKIHKFGLCQIYCINNRPLNWCNYLEVDFLPKSKLSNDIYFLTQIWFGECN